MPPTTPDFLPAVPEMVLAGMACLVLLVDLYFGRRHRMSVFLLAQAALVISALLCIALFPQEPVTTFDGSFKSDAMGAVLKVFVILVTYFVLFYSKVYLDERDLHKGEYYVLALFAVLGMMILVSAGSLLTLYLGLELMSLCLYALVAMNRESSAASEAAMKYFVLGALASGCLLYGMSLLYGATGTLDLERIREFGTDGAELDIILVLGLVFTVVGVAFKLGAAPFHMWVPDVYEGATTSVTLFIATAPKIAAFGMLMRLLVDGMSGLRGDWIDMLTIVAVLSMGVGNIIAIAQSNLKRMLGYSTVAHVGFLLLGIIAGTRAGYAASMFYIIVYSLMGLGAFGMIVVLGGKGFESDRLDDFRGLNERSPWLAFLVLVVMLSMAGMPPFVGFWAKWSVLREVVAADQIWLATLAVVFAVIGLFYYLRVVWLVYFEKAVDSAPPSCGTDVKIMISTNALAILALGVYPGALLALCVSALGAG